VGLGLALGLKILLSRTRLGVAMRAVVDNRDLAALAGARPDVVSGFSWALGCSLAAIAGSRQVVAQALRVLENKAGADTATACAALVVGRALRWISLRAPGS